MHSYASVTLATCTQCEPIVYKNNTMFSWQSSPQRKQYQLVVLLSWQSSPQRKQYQLVVLLSWQSSPQRKQYQLVVLLSWQSSPQRKQYQLVVLLSWHSPPQRKQYQLVVLLSWQSSPQRKQYQLVVLLSSLACWVLDLLLSFPCPWAIFSMGWRWLFRPLLIVWFWLSAPPPGALRNMMAGFIRPLAWVVYTQT